RRGPDLKPGPETLRQAANSHPSEDTLGHPKTPFERPQTQHRSQISARGALSALRRVRSAGALPPTLQPGPTRRACSRRPFSAQKSYAASYVTGRSSLMVLFGCFFAYFFVTNLPVLESRYTLAAFAFFSIPSLSASGRPSFSDVARV